MVVVAERGRGAHHEVGIASAVVGAVELEELHHAADRRACVLVRHVRVADDDGVGPFLLDGGCHVVGDLVDGVVPADALELSFDALLVGAAHGVHDAVGRVDEFKA